MVLVISMVSVVAIGNLPFADWTAKAIEGEQALPQPDQGTVETVENKAGITAETPPIPIATPEPLTYDEGWLEEESNEYISV